MYDLCSWYTVCYDAGGVPGQSGGHGGVHGQSGDQGGGPFQTLLSEDHPFLHTEIENSFKE